MRRRHPWSNVGAAQEPLDELIAEAPDAILGQAANAHFGGRLPYLFKILDVHKMLSIQAHPTLAQARRALRERTRRASASRQDTEITKTITTSRKSAWR